MLLFPCLILVFALTPPALGVIGGVDFPVYTYPFLISIRYLNRHHCAGFLYQDGYALTPAHCISNKDSELPKYLVVAREHNIRCEEGYEEFRTILKVHHHKLYNPTAGVYDIAVIQLEQGNPFPNDPDLQYPTLMSPKEFIYPKTAIIVGWGPTVKKLKGPQSPDLYPTHANLTQLDLQACSILYGTSKYLTEFENMCYGDKTTNGCKDDGSPLMCGGVLCGMLIYDESCSGPADGKPAIFTNPGYYADFISEIINTPTGGGRSITKDPPGINVVICGGYYETTHGNIKLQGLSSGQKCHFAIQTTKSELTINLKESTMKEGDSLTITKFCKVCPCGRINMMDKVGIDQKIQSSLIMVVVTIGKSNPTLPRGFTMTFNSTGYPSSVPPLTGFKVLNTSTSGSYSHPTTGGKYGNNEVSLVVFDPPPKYQKYAYISIKEVDIEGDGYDEECIYDALSVYANEGDWYKRVKRVCGKKRPKPLRIDGGYGIMSMITDDETAGKGFSFEYKYH